MTAQPFLSPRVHRASFVLGWTMLLLSLGQCLRTNEAYAQAPTYQGAQVRRGDDVIIWRMCTGERSPRAEHFDLCTAMIGTIARTAARRGISIGRQAQDYSHVFPNERRAGTTRRWILTMQPNGRRPAHWRHARWAPYRDDLLALLAHVRAVLAGRVADPCAEDRPVHFGNARDGRRMGDWVRVCPWVDDRQMLWAEVSS